MSFKQVHLSLSTLSIVAEKSKKLYVFDEISKLLASKYRLIWNLREDNLSCGNIIWNYSIFNIPERLGSLVLFFIFIISLLFKAFSSTKDYLPFYSTGPSYFSNQNVVLYTESYT